MDPIHRRARRHHGPHPPTGPRAARGDRSDRRGPGHRRQRGHPAGGRTGRGRRTLSGIDRRIRQEPCAIRTSDRQLPGTQAPDGRSLRRDCRREGRRVRRVRRPHPHQRRHRAPRRQRGADHRGRRRYTAPRRYRDHLGTRHASVFQTRTWQCAPAGLAERVASPTGSRGAPTAVNDHVALRAGIPPFYVMDVWLAAAGRQRSHGDLVNLSAGQPSVGAPEPVRAAAAAALHLNELGYTVALGIPELRTAIAADYQRRHGIDVESDAVVVTTGSSGGFLLAFLACFDVGDRVALASPGYPCYRNILSALGCEVVEIQCGPETRFQPTAQMLAELDPPVQGVIVASPANPPGTVIPPAELAAIASWCDASGVRLISDEVYHGLVYSGAPQTSCAWSTSRNAMVVNSFSKYFAMTGWRLGWLLVPTALRRAVDRLTGNFTICPPVLSQHAAVAAFTPEAVEEADGHLRHYAVNRKLLLDGLRSIGLDRLAPADGAFYVYADVSDFTTDSLAFCSKLLADTGVAIAPGIDFDTVHGGSFVRLSFAGPTPDVEEALRRIEPWLNNPPG